MKKSTLSIVLTLVLLLSLTTTAFAAAGKTVTFNGGYIYSADKGKPGTIKADITNITKTKKNEKIDEKELMTYVDDETVANSIISYTDDGDSYTAKDVVTGDDGVTVYYANSTPVVITTKSPLSWFWYSYKGNVVKATYTPKYYSFNDYLSNPDKAKVLKKKPSGDYLLAPGTTMKITKPGKYLFILKDDGMISDSPASAFCVIITK